MPKKKKTTASGEPVMVQSVRRTRSRRMKFCVQRGLGALPSTSKAEGKITAGFFPLRAECINTGIACYFFLKYKNSQREKIPISLTGLLFFKFLREITQFFYHSACVMQ